MGVDKGASEGGGDGGIGWYWLVFVGIGWYLKGKGRKVLNLFAFIFVGKAISKA